MNREAIGVVLFLMGAVVARLSFTGDYLSFVKQSLLVPLLLSALVLVVLGALELRAGAERRDEDEDPEVDPGDGHDHEPLALSDTGDDHGHHHAGAGPRMGALLLAPLAVLMLVPAAPLGAFAADNGAANRLAEMTVYGELPTPVDGAVEIVLPELIGRAILEPSGVEGEAVRTIGFVVPSEDDPDTYLLSRFTVGCCAVDAAPYQVVVDTGGRAPIPELEEWVEVIVRFDGEVVPTEDAELPVVTLVAQEVIEEPDVPYVY